MPQGITASRRDNKEEDGSYFSLQASIIWLLILIFFVLLIWFLVEGKKKLKKVKES